MSIRSQSGEWCLEWVAIDQESKEWFSCGFQLPEWSILHSSNPSVSEVLRNVLREASALNPAFLQDQVKTEVETRLGFDPDWGLGSSSTMICNIAKWAECDAFRLSDKAFGGSGADIAVGMLGSELLYHRPPAWDSFVYRCGFEDELFFIYLGRKQNSREEIKKLDEKSVEQWQIDRVSAISRELAVCRSVSVFRDLLDEHEQILASVLGRSRVKELHFNDFNGSVKSLGAWGGDFVLACGKGDVDGYFRSRGYTTIIRYSEMIKK
jgi:hypothetical protein